MRRPLRDGLQYGGVRANDPYVRLPRDLLPFFAHEESPQLLYGMPSRRPDGGVSGLHRYVRGSLPTERGGLLPRGPDRCRTWHLHCGRLRSHEAAARLLSVQRASHLPERLLRRAELQRPVSRARHRGVLRLGMQRERQRLHKG